MTPPRESGALLARIGDACARHAGLVAAGWGAAVVVAALAAARLPALLSTGSGDIPDSPSLAVDTLLRREFAPPQAHSLVLTLRSHRMADESEIEELAFFRRLKAEWAKSPDVAGVTLEEDLADERLLPARDTGHVIYLSLRTAETREAEQAVVRLRAAAAPLLAAARDRWPDLEWALTGRAALTVDLNQFNAVDTALAELRALPLILFILVFAFGSLAAAGVPALLGVVSMTVTLGVVFLLARNWHLSNLVHNVASMIGLAVGIDYSLFIIHRYRRELAGRSDATAADRQAALRTAMCTAGKAVFYSGLSVMAGMAGLLFTPLMETRSLGVGGVIVVVVAVLAALTLLPALLTLLGRGLEWPAALARRLQGGGARVRWQRWADLVMRHPLAGAGLSLALLLLLAWPAQWTRFGFPEGRMSVPAELEFSRGLELLRAMKLGGLLAPVQVLATDAAGGPAFTRGRLGAMLAFSARLRADPRVATVFSPVDLRDGWTARDYEELYQDIPKAFATFPQMRELFLSVDGRRMLWQVVLRQDTPFGETKRFAAALPGWFAVPGLTAVVGGQAAQFNDFDVAMTESYARCISWVVATTLVVLLAVFRAPLVSAKALVLNFLSVLAGYGAVVWVFQLGHGSAWLGVPAPTEVVPLTIPLVLFCVLFGLSMDYEVFLLSRAREGFLRTGDSGAGVREALVETGPVITSAALIMLAVFGAFLFARVVLVQMLGLGLAVAVLVDATVIRLLLAPGLMAVAGRWNWWPVTGPKP